MGLAAKRWAPNVSLGLLLIAAMILDFMAIASSFAGIGGRAESGNPWSHGLFMSLVWSVAATLLIGRLHRDSRAGVVVDLVIFSHWVLDFLSHPIPFPSFSWRSYGHPLPPDLPLLFAGSPKVGLGLHNCISAVQATALELAMLLLAAAVYAVSFSRNKRGRTLSRREKWPSALYFLIFVLFQCLTPVAAPSAFRAGASPHGLPRHAPPQWLRSRRRKHHAPESIPVLHKFKCRL